MLADRDIDRYGRQILLAEVGGRGQERILASEATIHGHPELVGTIGDFLARAGIGTVRQHVSPDSRLRQTVMAEVVVFPDGSGTASRVRHEPVRLAAIIRGDEACVGTGTWETIVHDLPPSGADADESLVVPNRAVILWTAGALTVETLKLILGLGPSPGIQSFPGMALAQEGSPVEALRA